MLYLLIKVSSLKVVKLSLEERPRSTCCITQADRCPSNHTQLPNTSMKIASLNITGQFAGAEINANYGTTNVRNFLNATGCEPDGNTTSRFGNRIMDVKFGSEARADSVKDFSVEFLQTEDGQETPFFVVKDNDGKVTIEGVVIGGEHPTGHTKWVRFYLKGDKKFTEIITLHTKE